jgi:hypothetical protein
LSRDVLVLHAAEWAKTGEDIVETRGGDVLRFEVGASPAYDAIAATLMFRSAFRSARRSLHAIELSATATSVQRINAVVRLASTEIGEKRPSPPD